MGISVPKAGWQYHSLHLPDLMYKHQLLLSGPPWFAPAAPYYRFMKEVLQSTALEMPVGTLYPSIVKAIASKWKELPKEEKKMYVNACVTEKQKRAEELVSASSRKGVSDVSNFVSVSV